MSHTDEQKRFYQALDARRRLLEITWSELCRQAEVRRGVIYELKAGRNVLSDSIFLLNGWMKRTAVQNAVQGVQVRVQNVDSVFRLTHN